ncbi:MAG TPA: hypothetical protein VEU07_08675 [Candidatus Acidoferrum sp.]|nr:hypothetical protein [Candidatus Acidoferrum sp.]
MTGAALHHSMAQSFPGMLSMAKANVPDVGFRLDRPATLEQAYGSHRKSIE